MWFEKDSKVFCTTEGLMDYKIQPCIYGFFIVGNANDLITNNTSKLTHGIAHSLKVGTIPWVPDALPPTGGAKSGRLHPPQSVHVSLGCN